MNFKISTQNGIMEAALFGEMDHHSAKSLREEIDTAIAMENPMILRLDLSQIHFCDSSGLGFIMGRYRKMQAIGGNLTLVDPSAPTRKILRLAGLDRFVRTETGKNAGADE